MAPLLENSISSSFNVAYTIPPSLGNFMTSLIAGAVVLTAIAAAVAFISLNDRVTRNL